MERRNFLKTVLVSPLALLLGKNLRSKASVGVNPKSEWATREIDIQALSKAVKDLKVREMELKIRPMYVWTGSGAWKLKRFEDG